MGKARLNTMENMPRATYFVERNYRLTMVTWGVLTLPFRRLQELLGKGDEIILLARNGADG